eukprot:10194243-Karenia_brevis.AAC.1
MSWIAPTPVFRLINNAITILLDTKLRQLWDWHVCRYLGRRQLLLNRADAKIERLMAEEMHRIDSKPLGASLQPAPTPKSPAPVKAKPVPKSKLKEMDRAKSSVPRPTQSGSQWLGPSRENSSSSEDREAGSLSDPSSMRDTGASVRNEGFTPFIAERIPVLQYSESFPDHRSNRDVPDLGDYIVQIIGVTSYDQFEHKSKKGNFPCNFDRVAWWNNFMSKAQSSKRSKIQPSGWLGTARGSAFGPVLEARWNVAETHYQVK